MTYVCDLSGNESVTETRYRALQLVLQLLIHFSASARCRALMLKANLPVALERVAHTHEPLSTGVQGAVGGGSGGVGAGTTGEGARGMGLHRFRADVLALLHRLWTILVTAPPSLTPPSSPSPLTSPAATAPVAAPQLAGKWEAPGGLIEGEMTTVVGREKDDGREEGGHGVRLLEHSSPARPAGLGRDWQGEEAAKRGSGMKGEAGRLWFVGRTGSGTWQNSTQMGIAEGEETSRIGDGGGWRRQGFAAAARGRSLEQGSPPRSEKLAEDAGREAWGHTVEKQTQEIERLKEEAGELNKTLATLLEAQDEMDRSIAAKDVEIAELRFWREAEDALFGVPGASAGGGTPEPGGREVVLAAEGSVVLTSDLCLSQSQSGRVQTGGGGDPMTLPFIKETAFKSPEQINQALFTASPIPLATASAPRPHLPRLKRLFSSGDLQRGGRAGEALAVKWSVSERRVRLSFAAWRSRSALARRSKQASAHSARKHALQTQARCLHAWDFSQRRQRVVRNRL